MVTLFSLCWPSQERQYYKIAHQENWNNSPILAVDYKNCLFSWAGCILLTEEAYVVNGWLSYFYWMGFILFNTGVGSINRTWVKVSQKPYSHCPLEGRRGQLGRQAHPLVRSLYLVPTFPEQWLRCKASGVMIFGHSLKSSHVQPCTVASRVWRLACCQGVCCAGFGEGGNVPSLHSKPRHLF